MKSVERLRNWLEARGVKHIDFAESIGETPVRLSRFLKGGGGLSCLEAYEQIERATAGAVTAAALVVDAAPSPKRAARGRAASRPKAAPPTLPAAPVPAPAPESPPPASDVGDVLADLAKLAGEAGGDIMGTLAPRFGSAVLGGLLKLAATARSEGVRMRALENLADRFFGRPVQRIVDATPRPPAEDAELVEAFASAIAKKSAQPAALPPATPEVPPHA